MEEFVKKLSQLLDLEHEVELEESQQILSQLNVKQLENRGICIRKLCITGQRCGFYGRTVYKLENSKHLSTLSTQNGASNINKKVFSSIFSVGNIVSIFTSTTPTENSGVVTHINPLSITVAFDQPPFTDQSFDETNVSLVKMNSDVTYKRLKRALICLLDNKHGPAKHIISVCFENALLLPVNPKYLISNTVAMNKDIPGDEFEIKIYNPQLNAVQRQTVLDVLSRQDISIIHGPPGTGKTTTVVECIIQCVRRSYKVLACAPSNIAVDNLLTKLAPQCRVVRLGHPARAAFELQKYSLDAQVTSCDSFDIIKQVRGEIEKAIGIGSKKKHKVNWSEVRELKKELHERENKVVYEILNAADVVLSTTTSASFDGPLKVLRKEHFNVVFIDECAQVIEPGCWIPLLHAGKCVLAGDHLQLPPTIISEEAAKGGLNVTLMERLISMHGTVAMSLLTTQYRMNSHIMYWPSQFLYGGMLIADDSVSQRLLSGLNNVECNAYTDTPLLFIDTAGCEYEESVPEEVSRSNEGEAGLVSVYVNMLIKFGLSPSEIAVIAPYSLQVELITTKLAAVGIDSVEVHTVDGFQGREKEVVIISFTRSNDRGEIGFLSEVRRTNVAITRAKRHLCVIGDSVTISNQGFIKGLLDYIQRFGEVRSGFDLLHEDVGIVNKSADSGPVKGAEVKSNQVREGEVSFLESKENERCLDEKIRKFTDNDNLETLEFAYLTSRERYLVHKLCEEIGLCHTSKGDGKERNILISKCVNEEILPVIDLNLEENHTCSIDSSANLFPKRDCDTQVRNDRILFETTTRHDSLIQCEICRKDIPRMNIVTHQAHCLRYTELNSKLDSAIITAKKATSHKRKSKKPGKCTVNKLHVDSNIKEAKKQLDLQDDFAVLEAAIKMKEVCNFNKCNESIKLIGEYCLYCKLHFCIKHCQYEVHGCTNMARSDNRISFMESSRTIPKKQRVELEKKYQSKLDEKAKSRKGKK